MQFYLSSRSAFAAILFSVSICWHTIADDANWSQFRGPKGTGIVGAKLPTDLENKKHQLWMTPIEGIGWSSPVIANGKIWFTSAITTQATPEQIAAKLTGDKMAGIKTVAQKVEFHAICLDANNGKQIRDIVLATVEKPEPINPMNSYASPTPAISGDQVICHFGNYGTWCLNAKSGESIWTNKLVVDHSVGPGSSPVIVGNKVLLVCDGMDKQFIAALNLSDGKIAWKTDRPPLRATNGEFRKAYCTPLLIEVNGRSMAIIPGAQWTVAYDPETGKELWRADCGDGFSVTPMPVYVNGLVIISTGYGKPDFVAIRPDGSGDVTKTHIAWRATKGAPTMPSMIAQDGVLYSINDTGILTSYDATTGNEKTRSRIGGNFSASPILAGGNLYLFDLKGIVTVVKADDQLTLVSKSDLGSPIYASPAIIGNDLILRTKDAVIRFAAK